MAAARVLGGALDTLTRHAGAGRVVVAGDFNDEPSDPAVEYLSEDGGAGRRPVNLMLPLQKKGEGTLFYDGRWWLFDQMMVSPQLAVQVRSAGILRFPFLFDREKTVIPWRTFAGLRYLGGFSDHLPVMLILQERKGMR